MKKILLTVLLATVPLTIAGCSIGNNSSNSSHSNKSAESSQSAVSSSEEKTSSTKKTVKTKKTTEALWDQSKDEKLAAFMKTWGASMDQNYIKRGPGNDTTSVGLHFPSDLDGKIPGSHFKGIKYDRQSYTAGWSDNGEGNKDINVVAIYEMPPKTMTYYHIYLFAFQNGKPIVYHTEQNQPQEYFYFDKTENQDLENGFDQIATTGKEPDNSTSGKDSDKNSSSSNSTNKLSSMTRSQLTDAEKANGNNPLPYEPIKNGDDAIRLVTQKYGNHGWTCAHGTAGMSSPIYFSIMSDDGNDTYYVYANGTIESSNDDSDTSDTSDSSSTKISSESEALQYLIKKQGDTGWKATYSNDSGSDKSWDFKDSKNQVADVNDDGTIQMDSVVG